MCANADTKETDMSDNEQSTHTTVTPHIDTPEKQIQYQTKSGRLTISARLKKFTQTLM